MTFDPDDDAIIYLLHKGKPVSFELDKVFSPLASQQDVSVAVGRKPRRRGWVGERQARPVDRMEKCGPSVLSTGREKSGWG